MSYDMFKSFGLDKIHDSLTDDFDYKDKPTVWQLVRTKSVPDSDGFMTDYAWYTDGAKHIFMFGDIDYTDPDEDYADWEAESETLAQEWFDSYEGFSDESDPWSNFEEDDLDEEYTGNANFMNEGFARVYGKGKLLGG